LNSRCCSRTACKQPPVYTLTFVYRDSTAVLGPLSAYEEPNTYDLCEKHAARLVAPRGWDIVRLPPTPEQERADDLEAIANVVREPRASVSRPVADSRTAGPRSGPPRPAPTEPVGQGIEVGRRGHLRVLRSTDLPGGIHTNPPRPPCPLGLGAVAPGCAARVLSLRSGPAGSPGTALVLTRWRSLRRRGFPP
jgi:hypothetical protein